MKPAHIVYLLIILASVGISGLSTCITSTFWNTVMLSIGCGGFSSALVAYFIDIRNSSVIKKDNEAKYKLIKKQYERLFRRLIFEAANECHGMCDETEIHTFEEWIYMLRDYACTSKNKVAVIKKCKHLSGILSQIKHESEQFQMQATTLILNNYPDIDKALKFFESQRIHAWGTLQQLNDGNYEAFCETTVILYNEFVKYFKICTTNGNKGVEIVFPDKYNTQTFDIKSDWEFDK